MEILQPTDKQAPGSRLAHRAAIYRARVLLALVAIGQLAPQATGLRAELAPQATELRAELAPATGQLEAEAIVSEAETSRAAAEIAMLSEAVLVDSTEPALAPAAAEALPAWDLGVAVVAADRDGLRLLFRRADLDAAIGHP